jgi:hypothetical protein
MVVVVVVVVVVFVVQGGWISGVREYGTAHGHESFQDVRSDRL